MRASLFTIETLDQAEDYLILAAITDDGLVLDDETAPRLLTLPGRVSGAPSVPPRVDALDEITRNRQALLQKDISERNARFFESGAEKLDSWADDLKIGLEREIKELDRRIREARRTAITAMTLKEKLNGQKMIKALESQRNQKRRSLFDAQDEVDRQREELIADIEARLRQTEESLHLFSIRWTLAQWQQLSIEA